MKLIYGYTQPIHELAERYIEREILCHDTMLIEAALNLPEQEESPFIEAFNHENIENWYNISPDWINNYLTDAQRAALAKAGYSTMEDFSDYYEDCDVKLTKKETKLLDDLHHEWKYRDSETLDIFEWYRVTQWLAEKLMDNGQPVLCNDYGYWWGRTCTGQAIILDGTIQQIA
ncbi:hypothetical protein [Spirosoma terrae]|uniref:Uncharacterized protein n=1 Tax=Spirosoma terrae TaxID=1968276 RepID=A0A6L9LF41_9BACT|nr:hypothetical protein [Spirosoma terrae]NDU99225.1 hypothetical protein [Spirosoma terrae]